MKEMKDLREKTENELGKMAAKERQELADLKSERALGKLTDGSQLEKKRTEIAQILTVLGEKEVLKEIEKRNAKKDA